jgi:RNA polymerase sigma-70 factor, ECF subfamily
LDIDVPLAEARYRDHEVSTESAEFTRHYETYRLAVYRYLRARCPSDEEAADLTAATFERAWTARRSFRGTADRYPAWLFAIARRQAIDAARRRHSERSRWRRWSDPAQAPDPADLALMVEQDARLTRHLGALPDLQREAILLRYAGGLTAGQIGSVIGKSEAATQKLISRALVTLKEAFDGDI